MKGELCVRAIDLQQGFEIPPPRSSAAQRERDLWLEQVTQSMQRQLRELEAAGIPVPTGYIPVDGHYTTLMVYRSDD